MDDSFVRIQWDPERDITLNKIEDVRSIQIGLSGEAAQLYVKQWIVKIEDVTTLAHAAEKAVLNGNQSELSLPYQQERVYPTNGLIEHTICDECE